MKYLYMKKLHKLKRILICPLDWGIGHATRMVPVIRLLQELGFEVFIGAGGRSGPFLKQEFPALEVFDFPGSRISYPSRGSLTLYFFLRIPRLIIGFIREHRELKRLARIYHFDLIISDNRYGCWHSCIPSVFVTHQLRIRLPGSIRFLTPILQQINYWFIGHYTQCWIPDFELHAILAGNLSHPARLPKNAFYIGALSRFRYSSPAENSFQLPVYDIMVILSGPEPQRTILEEIIMTQILRTNLTTIVVRGITEKDEMKVIDEHIHLYSHIHSDYLLKLMQQSFLVICRSGYSSIMDLVTVGKRAVLIPTPGQTEQEYLAEYLMQKKIFFSQRQDQFDLLFAIEMVRNYPGMVVENDYSFLKERIMSIIPAATNGKLSH